MAKRKLSGRQELKIRSDREMSVYKRDDMIQKSRHQLTVREQKAVLYAISKIRPEDTALQEYVFDIKDFYALCGLESDSYTVLKALLLGLKSKSWWMQIDDEGTESAVSWFNTVRTNKKSGKVTIKFHEDMMPFLVELTKQGAFYTGYSLQYVLPMSSQYAPRLYELLKSYQKNNRVWFFEVEELKKLMNAQSYDRWPDFRRRVIEPALEEINKYTDIKVAYDAKKEGRRIARIEFYMLGKKPGEILETQMLIQDELDGQYTIWDYRLQEESEESVKARFFRENL